MYSDNFSSWGANRLDPLLLYSYVQLQPQPVAVNSTHIYTSTPTLYIDGIFIYEQETFNISYPETEVYQVQPIVKPIQFPATPSALIQNSALDLAYTSDIDSDNFELETIIKLKRFDEITNIYIQESEDVITTRVLINLEKYDYSLMEKIFNTVEFPLKDKFETEKMIDFQYIYNTTDHTTPVEHFGKRIFHKE